MQDVNRYPLSWPMGWPRTKSGERKAAAFRESAMVTRNEWRDGRYQPIQKKGEIRVTMATARERIVEQIERLGGADLLLSTNVELTSYGMPRGGRAEPVDPGVACYFTLHGKDRVLACDRWSTVAENIAAIAAHIDAIRRVDRYGVGTLDQAFAGYDALPPPSADNRPPWRSVLGFKPDTKVTAEDVKVNYRALAKQAATEDSRLRDLNLAREAALRELGAA